LSEPGTYEGGDLEFLNINVDPQALSEQGACLVFPSFLPYGITPVTKGTKHIIVGHVHGAVFK
jgi:PKHD-type hydroxylase